MKIAVTYPSAATNIKNHSLVQQFSYLEKIVEDNNISDIIFISFNSTDFDLKNILKISKFKYPELIKSIKLGTTLENLFKKDFSYAEIAEKLIKSINTIHEIDTLYLFGNTMFGAKKIKDIINKYSDSKKGFNFYTNRNKIVKSIFFNLLINKYLIKTNHIVFDPSELDYEGGDNYNKFHCYSDSNLNLNRLDSLQYYLLNKESIIKIDKSLDFVFGATILHTMRNDLHPFFVSLLNYNSNTNKVFYFNKNKPEHKSYLPRPEYLELIKKSKYTLVVKAYEKSSFSGLRFIESIFCKCIPLLNYDSNYHHLNTLGFNLEWLEENLVINKPEDIFEKITNLDYNKTIMYLYDTLFNIHT
jgi:hypothetical protein